jgi:predicted RNase H-like HicB family nuclease
MRTLSYRITLQKEPDGGYTVLVTALPGCVTYGKIVEEAIEMAKDAIRGYVESLIEDGEEIPLEELIECRADRAGSCIDCFLSRQKVTVILKEDIPAGR